MEINILSIELSCGSLSLWRQNKKQQKQKEIH
jgi:hypothetical protein